MVTGGWGGTLIRDVSPLGRNHGELSPDDLLRDGQVPEVLVEGRVPSQTGTHGDTGGTSTQPTDAAGRHLPDEQQDPQAPGVHRRPVAPGGRLGENLRSQVGRGPTQSPHQHGLLQDPGLVKVCHLTHTHMSTHTGTHTHT